MSKRIVGAHVSASGGLYKAIERANAIGANAAQIFSGSPRVWKRKPLENFDLKKMFSKRKELHVNPIFTHSLYLANLATDKPDLLRKSFGALKYDLEFDAAIQGSGIIVHIGSHTGRGWVAVKEQVAEQIVKLVEATPEESTFLIENSAGQKGKLCSDLSEIRWLLDRVAELMELEHGFGGELGSSRLGWCYDTCHGHAAGYTPTAALEKFSELDLVSTLRCIHVNDSRDDFDSGRDRHENLGKGNLSIDDLRAFLNDDRIVDVPLLLEVPGLDGKGPDAPNIKFLQELLD